MKIVTVIPLSKGLPKENLTYFTAKDVEKGNIVRVPLRNKKVLALAISVEDVTNAKINIKDLSFNLKKIIDSTEQHIFRPELLEAGLEISDYFVSSKNNTITSLIPSIFREEYDEIAKFKNESSENIEQKNIPKNIKAEKLLFQAPLEERISFYKTMIRGAFAEKKSIFIVLPTEKDIEFFSTSLSKGIENFTFCLHSGLSAKKQLENIEKSLALAHPVLILATAPYLALPRWEIGTVILERESSNAYKTIGRPYIDLRMFVELFASKINTRLILADSVLRFETIARKEIDGLGEISPLSFRINFEGELKIINKKTENEENKKFRVLGTDATKEIQDTLLKNKNVFIFSLRKGLATMTVCKDCNETVLCDTCLAPVVLYLSRDNTKRMFICNRCKIDKSPDSVCQKCGSWNLMPLGIGTDTVFEEISELFSNNKIFKLDKEIAKTNKQAEKIAQDFENEKGAILVGTEMAFAYIKDKVPLSIIASFDSLWSIPNFKMSEKITQLIVSIADKTEKTLLIQTKNEQDPAILAIKTENLSSFIKEEINDRKILGYPPFKRFIKITYLGNKVDTTKTKHIIGEMFKEYNPEIFSGFIPKVKDQYATNILIKMDCKNWSLPLLSAGSSIDQKLLEKLSSLPPQFSINVNPDDLL